jgi:glycosyltransferase involved in cell wall biosynthesis
VKVFVFKPEILQYEHDNIEVFCGRTLQFISLLNKVSPDIVLAHSPSIWMSLSIPKILLRKRIPFIVYIHGYDIINPVFYHSFAPWELTNKFKHIVRSNIKSIGRALFCLNKADALIFPSRWTHIHARINSLFKNPKSYIIPNPINTDIFAPKAVRNENQPLRGLSVRGLSWKYGIDILIKAFSKSPYPLTILGKGSLLSYYKELIKKFSSNIKIKAESLSQTELSKFYEDFDFCVIPSRIEAQCVTMCETMAKGIPVIANKVAALPEFVQDYHNGLLVHSCAPDEMHQKVLELANDKKLRATLAVNGARYVKDKLSTDVIIPREIALFQTITHR